MELSAHCGGEWGWSCRVGAGCHQCGDIHQRPGWCWAGAETLASAYDIAHRYETTRQTAQTVTQLMYSGAVSATEWITRVTTVCENDNMLCYRESERAVMRHICTPERAQKPFKQWQPKKTDWPKRRDLGQVVCHNCSDIGYFQRNCPSPHHPKQPAVNFTLAPAQAPDTVVVSAKNFPA